MNQYVVGQEVKLKAGPFLNEKGEPTDPTTVIFKVIDTSGEETDYTNPTRDSTGVYHQYHPVVESEAGGTTEYRVEGTGALVAAEENAYKVRGTQF